MKKVDFFIFLMNYTSDKERGDWMDRAGRRLLLMIECDQLLNLLLCHNVRKMDEADAPAGLTFSIQSHNLALSVCHALLREYD